MFKTFYFQILANLVSANLIILGMFFLTPGQYLDIQFVTATMAIGGILHIGIIDGLEIRLIQSNDKEIANSTCSFYALVIFFIFISYFLASIFLKINISHIGLVAGLFVVITNLYSVKYKVIGQYNNIVKFLSVDKVILILLINLLMASMPGYIKYAFLFQFASLLILLTKEEKHSPMISKYLFLDLKVGFPLLLSNLAAVFLLAGLIFLYQNILDQEKLSALAFAALISSIAIGFSSQLGNIVLGRLRNKDAFPVNIKILFFALLSFTFCIYLFENYKEFLIVYLMNKELLIYFYYFIPIAIMEFINFMFLLPLNKINRQFKKITYTPIFCFLLFLVFKTNNIELDLIIINLLIFAKTLIYFRGISIEDFNFVSKL
jgi:hypothetical protein